MTSSPDLLTRCFTNCRRILGQSAWERILSALDTPSPRAFIRELQTAVENGTAPLYLPDLARVELKGHELQERPHASPDPISKTIVNPELTLLPVNWLHLTSLLDKTKDTGEETPVQQQGHILIWRHPATGKRHCRYAVEDDLLALKLVVETVDVREAARLGKTPRKHILAVLHRAIRQGLLIAPQTGIQRDPRVYSDRDRHGPFGSADVFTLQWHITQACDLHCRHCYDRSERSRMPLKQALALLEDLFDFTRAMHVRGQISFTGGNPLLYPDFMALYTAAADMGFTTAILGNPTDSDTLDALKAIQSPTHYQISLEGLEPYNDYIRGAGHFNRSLAFLDLLREKGIYAMVMLTLNRDNMDQVLPLADILKGRADGFTFNRLAMVGEARNLSLPEPADFQAFLQTYLEAASYAPHLTLKDNLFNIFKLQSGESPIGGCTGYGCGAAFNFVSLLADGEVHACRKFPSRIGNIKTASLLEIYRSSRAEQYRSGSTACRGCSLFSLCRGCPAVVYGMGLDVFNDRDPFCFFTGAPDLNRFPSRGFQNDADDTS